MSGKTRSGLAVLALMGALLPARAPIQAESSIVLDGSLGERGEVRAVEVDGGLDYQITDDLGRFSDNYENLFHSFDTFSISEGDVATFSSSRSPQRVIARVTGGSPSEIDGILRSTISEADLFLLNPSGIFFGKQAKLDVLGSFYASSADVLRFFDEGPDFDAADASPGPLLSSAEPAAFGFTRANPGQIRLDITENLAVPPGKILSFIGGDSDPGGLEAGVHLTSNSSVYAPNILAPGATIQIAAAAVGADIPIDPIAFAELDPRALAPGTLGDVVIEGVGAGVDVSSPYGGGTPAGEVLIRGERFVLANSSRLFARHSAVDASAVGGIDIAVTGAVEIKGNSEVTTWSYAAGRGGDISLTGDSVIVRDGSNLYAYTSEGPAPDVFVEATSVSLLDGGQIVSLGLPASSGQGGNVSVTAGQLEIRGVNAAIDSNPTGSGPGGAIAVWADRVAVSDGGQITSRPHGSGPGGQIEIHAGRVDVTDGSQIASINRGTDAGGALAILDADTIAVGGASRILSRSESDGPGGAIQLVTGSLDLTDAGRVYSEARAGGAGGALGVTAENVRVSSATNRAEGTFIATNTISTESGAGTGGALTIEADAVELVDGGQIYSRTEGAGGAGLLSVVDADWVRISGVSSVGEVDLPSGITSRAGKFSTASEGGLLTIDTRVLSLESGGQIASSTLGLGGAGDISITASERVRVEGGDGRVSIISAASNANEINPIELGAGGNIEIDTGVLELRDGGQITASASGSGDAGRIAIDADRVEIAGAADALGVNVSGVFSQSRTLHAPEGGHGGNIEITAAESVEVRDGGRISARSTGTGRAGDITIVAGNRFESRGGRIITEALQSSGGKIAIEAREIVQLVDTEATTNVLGGGGGGGDIDIDSKLVVLNSSRVTTEAVLGEGGDITIVSEVYLASSDSVVSADSLLSNDGEIEIAAPEANLGGELAALSSSLLDASALLASRCEARRARSGSFVVATRDAMLAPPDASLSSLEPYGLGAAAPSAEVEPCPNWEETP